jgi:ATP-dependent Clp protease ATP-binding subunit ClpC
MESAQQEAQRFQHSYIATEHILLGSVREDQGIAAAVLDSLGVTLERARKQTVRRRYQKRYSQQLPS